MPTTLFDLWSFLYAPDDGGGSGGDDGSSDGDGDSDDGGADGGEELGAAGVRALEQEREARKAAERKVRETTRDLERLRSEGMSEQEKAIAQARQEARTEALTVANSRVLRAEVTALAAGRLANPQLAPRLLDLDQFEVNDDGDVDRKAISRAIKELLEKEPYLALDAKRPQGSGDGGARGRSSDSTDDMNSRLRQAAGRGT